MIRATLPKRQSDSHGSGEYGASRGSRTHNGIDYVCMPGALIMSPVSGFVTKIGYPYSDDLSFRYVEVKDTEEYRHRIFYIDPTEHFMQDMPGSYVDTERVIGTAQDLTQRYPGITPHVHYEIKNPSGDFIDPAKYISGWIK